MSVAGEGQVLGWDGTDFVWTYATESPTDVLALISFDGATTYEDFADASTYSHPITYIDNPDFYWNEAVKTDDTKFGDTAIDFDKRPFTLPVSLGADDFCVEFWIKRPEFHAFQTFFSMSDPGGTDVMLSVAMRSDSNATLNTSFRSSDGSLSASEFNSIEETVWQTQWKHFAIYRRAGAIYVTLNGLVDHYFPTGLRDYDFSNSTELAFGGHHPTHPFYDTTKNFDGFMDELRVTVGSAVPYPGALPGEQAFTAPESPFPVPGASSGGGGDDPRITNTQITNWDTAYGWGDHSTAGYLTEFTESDPTVPQHVKDITEAQITAWDAGTGGGGGAVDSVNGQTGTVVLTASDVGAIDTETDPTVPQHVKDITQADIDAWNAGGGSGADSRISNQQITNWDEAHGWGDHAQAGYLTDFTEADPTVPTWVKDITEADIAAWNAGGGDDSRITNQQIIDWDTAYGWGDHAQAGYLTDFTESDPTVPAWVKNITQEDIDAWNADPAAQTIVEIGAEPVSPNQGDLWLNDVNSTVYIYDAGNWLQFPIGEAGEVMSSQVVLGDGGTFSLRLEGTEDLVTQADANKFIEAQLEVLHTRIDTENNSLWEYSEAEQVIKPANDKNITSSSAVFGAMQSGTLAASTAAFTTVSVAEFVQAKDFLDENGQSLAKRGSEVIKKDDEQFASIEASLLALDGFAERIDGGSY